MVTDPIADLLTRIRNAYHARRDTVVIPGSRTKRAICEIMAAYGFIAGYEWVAGALQGTLVVRLKYQQGRPAARVLQRISKPGCRVYRQLDQIKPLLAGSGVEILSTSHGVLADGEAQKRHVGGEVLCQIW